MFVCETRPPRDVMNSVIFPCLCIDCLFAAVSLTERNRSFSKYRSVFMLLSFCYWKRRRHIRYTILIFTIWNFSSFASNISLRMHFYYHRSRIVFYFFFLTNLNLSIKIHNQNIGYTFKVKFGRELRISEIRNRVNVVMHTYESFNNKFLLP